MWRILADAARGTGHERDNLPCQDSFQAVVVDAGRASCLVVACADGAGSAVASEVGSRCAVDFFVSHCAEVLAAQGTFSEDDARRAYSLVVERLVEEATERGLQPRDLACTLLTAVVSESASLFAQVGDGAIVTRRDGEAFTVVFWPESDGQYANETVFVTSPNASASLLVSTGPSVEEVALFSDGLQRLALNFATKTAHSGFFRPFFKAIEEREPEDLVIEFRTFLTSQAVNERTDDDKSLVLAKRHVGRAACLPS